MNGKFRQWWMLDLLACVGLMLYVLAGADEVPLHGDEPTLIYMSRDYHFLVQERDLDPILYAADADPAEQELRLINGTVTKWTIGLAWDLAGMTVADVNAQWVWDWTPEQNAALGHMPSDRLLRVARRTSAVFAALSVAGVMAVAWQAARRETLWRHMAVWVAGLLYATNPAVLLNGRRAMMEGPLLCFSAWTVWAALRLAQSGPDGARRTGWAAIMGVLGGLVIASKHPGAITVLAAFGAVWALPALSREIEARGERLRAAFAPRHIRRLALAGGLVLLVFLALNPTWWSDPLGMPDRVLTARRGLMDSQVGWYGGYGGLGERVTGFLEQAFRTVPQYYEAAGWQDYIGDDIAAYEDSGWAGRSGAWGWTVLQGLLCAAGLWALVRRWRAPGAWIVLVWLGVTALALVALTPLAWQRYYLLIFPPLAVVEGVGAAILLATGFARARE